jgi:hypothetical protein
VLTIMFATLLVGAALGLRFRMYSLLPAIGLAVIIIAADGMLHRSSLVAVAGELTLAVIAMQVGYLLGILVRGASGSAPAFVRAQARTAGLRKSGPSLADS